MLLSNSLNLSGLLLASLALISPSSAYPTDLDGNGLFPRAGVDPKDPLTWDTQYIKDHYIRFIPEKDSCYFYTGMSEKEPIKWAGSHKGTTVFDVYHCYTDGKDGHPAIFNPGQFPYKNYVDAKRKGDWFRLTSRAYAQVCSGVARLAIKDGTVVDPKSIWNTDEYDAIVKKETGITKVLVVDPVKKLEGDYDPRPGVKQTYPRSIDDKSELKARDTTELPESESIESTEELNSSLGIDPEAMEDEEEVNPVLTKRESVTYPRGGTGKKSRGTCPKLE